MEIVPKVLSNIIINLGEHEYRTRSVKETSSKSTQCETNNKKSRFNSKRHEYLNIDYNLNINYKIVYYSSDMKSNKIS